MARKSRSRSSGRNVLDKLGLVRHRAGHVSASSRSTALSITSLLEGSIPKRYVDVVSGVLQLTFDLPIFPNRALASSVVRRHYLYSISQTCVFYALISHASLLVPSPLPSFPRRFHVTGVETSDHRRDGLHLIDSRGTPLIPYVRTVSFFVDQFMFVAFTRT